MAALSPELQKKGERHLVLARRQEAQVAHLREICPGYAVTALWYAAFHHLHAYLLLRFGRVVPEHKDMRPIWRDYPDLGRKIRVAYELLKSRSEWYRYEDGDFTPAQVDELKKEMERLRDFLWAKFHRPAPPSSATPPPAPAP